MADPAPALSALPANGGGAPAGSPAPAPPGVAGQPAGPKPQVGRKRQRPNGLPPRRSPRGPQPPPTDVPAGVAAGGSVKPASDGDLELWALGWNNTLWPPSKAVEDTLVRAEAAAATLGGLTGIRVMLPSYVTGDYLLELPMKFAASLPQVPGRHPLVLRGATDPAETPVTWMRLPDGPSGLTGGWRTFAVEHQLAVGDVVLFERLAPTSLRAHVFHAMTEAERKALAASDLKANAAAVDAADMQSVARRVKCRRQAVKPSFDAEYEVEAIEGHRVGPDGTLRYLTAWKGYHRRTWEPRHCFVLGDVITAALAQYEQAHGLAAAAPPPPPPPRSPDVVSAGAADPPPPPPPAPTAAAQPPPAPAEPAAARKQRRKADDPSPPELEYEVEEVLDHVTVNGEVFYLTAWKGYAERTWEPRSSFVLGSVVTNALLRYEREKGIARPAARGPEP